MKASEQTKQFVEIIRLRKAGKDPDWELKLKYTARGYQQAYKDIIKVLKEGRG